MGTGNRFWIAGALSSVAILGCSDHTRPSSPTRSVPLTQPSPAERALAAGTLPLAVDNSNMPRLLHASDSVALPAATPASSATRHIKRLASTWGVDALPDLVSVGDVEVLGGTVSRLRQVIDGVPVEGGELRVMTRTDGTLVAASGLLRSASSPRTAASWSFGETGAIARVLATKYKTSFDVSTLKTKHRTSDGAVFAGRSNDLDVSLARARKVWFASSRAPNATLLAAWVVEAYASNTPTTSSSSDAFRMIIAERDSRILDERNLIADADFTYRVFAQPGDKHPAHGPIVGSTAHPTGHPNGEYPPYATSSLVTVNALNKTNDPWIPTGRTETHGNNAEAYADFNAPDGLTFGDFRATTTSANTFDRAYDFSAAPLASQAQQMSGITSLFYTINWNHDFWYDAGFTEAAGNGQNSNYGRGGEDRDAILAEAQDNALGGSRNNANMSTPDDGLPPRMQVFVWGGKETRKLTLGAREAASGTAAFGPTNFEVTGDIELADDGVGTGSDACTALPTSLAGKIVLVDRGSCSFKTKTLNVQTAGGIGVIIGNNAASTSPPGIGDDATITTAITIPTVSILQSEAVQLKTDLAAGPVATTLKRSVGVDLEGTLDASVVAHEFGHYLHHRLSQCSTPSCRAMSEGWGDFCALIFSARSSDNLTGAYPVGVYSTQSFTSDPAYYGIRRAPYSADHTINDLSYRHMTDGVALPTSHPFLISGINSQVHNSGEIWASMLWEGYVALQQAGTSFDDVRMKMRKYVVAGLLLSPPDGTPTEVRDAILTATRAASPADHDILAAAFARRGFGTCAIAAPRSSTNFQGIVESSVVTGNATLGAPAMALATTCDSDDVIDAGESAQVTLPIANTGPAALSNVVATLSTTTPGITITSQSFAVGSLGAYGTATATFGMMVDASVVDLTAADFTIKLVATGGCADTVERTLGVVINTDDLAKSSATDSFDAIKSVWTSTSTDTAWSHTRPAPLDGIWFGANSASVSDSSLTSPTITADASAPVTITFSHKFSFEYSANTYWDGGLIEVSTDAGATWQDIATLTATSPYNATLTTTSDNPLGGRAAFGRTNTSYPNTDTITLDLGMNLAGQTFQLRFRIATDGGTAGPGWEIDDIAFTGINGTPFPTLVADAGGCDGEQPDMPDGGMPDGSGNPSDGEDPTAGGCCQSQRSPTGSFALGFFVLALLRRRRR